MARSRQRANRPPATAKPRSDIYTALLVVSLLAQIAGAVFLYFDYDRFKPGTSAPPMVNSNIPAAGPPNAAGGGAPPAGGQAAPVAPPAGQ